MIVHSGYTLSTRVPYYVYYATGTRTVQVSYRSTENGRTNMVHCNLTVCSVVQNVLDCIVLVYDRGYIWQTVCHSSMHDDDDDDLLKGTIATVSVVQQD